MNGDGTTGYIGVSDDPGTPTDGGTVTYGSYSFPRSLDPAQTQATGPTGGTEMAAVYDTLVRVDDSLEFQPQLAEELSPNEDYTKFTLTLKDDVTFSDGTPLDSKAVQRSINRFIDNKGDEAEAWSDIVAKTETPDVSTIEFNLNRSWDRFPVLLSLGAGMVVGPNSDADESFSPIGAGPFTVDKFAIDEELVLKPRTDYHGGKPHLSKLRFVPTDGAQSQLDAMNSGDINMSYIFRDEEVIEQAIENGHAGYLSEFGMGSVGVINNRDGRPGADLRVREAIAYGVDPQQLDERAGSGEGKVSSDMVLDTSPWYSGAKGVQYDPELAKQKLDEAKSSGFDGQLTYLTLPGGSPQAAALSVQAQLNDIGFDVSIDYAASVTDLVRKVYADRDYDITRIAYPFRDSAPYLRLASGLASDSNNNGSGYQDEEMDRLLLEVQTSTTDESKSDAIAKVQERANETIPYTIWGPATEYPTWSKTIHGIKRSATSIILLDEAWIEES